MSRFLSFVVFLSILNLACGSTNGDLVVSTTRPSATVATSSVPDSSPTTTVSVGATTAVTTTVIAESWFGPRHPLTGLPAPDGPLQHPALAVKVGNNDMNSLPHEGLEDADVVYEALIENGKTRFVAIYQSNVPSRVGPIRSARSTDIDLIGNLNLPFFAYWGSNEGVGAEVAAASRRGTFIPKTTTNDGQKYLVRDITRGESPYDGVLQASGLMESIAGATPEPIFDYGESGGVSIPSLGVHWDTGARSVDYLWDTKSSRWLRYQDGKPLLNSSGVQLAADNVLVLYVDYDRSSADSNSPQALTTGNGDGWLFRDGTVTGITWDRQFPVDPWRLEDDDLKRRIQLDFGTTWVALAQLGEASMLDPLSVAVLTGQ